MAVRAAGVAVAVVEGARARRVLLARAVVVEAADAGAVSGEAYWVVEGVFLRGHLPLLRHTVVVVC